MRVSLGLMKGLSDGVTAADGRQVRVGDSVPEMVDVPVGDVDAVCVPDEEDEAVTLTVPLCVGLCDDVPVEVSDPEADCVAVIEPLLVQLVVGVSDAVTLPDDVVEALGLTVEVGVDVRLALLLGVWLGVCSKSWEFPKSMKQMGSGEH